MMSAQAPCRICNGPATEESSRVGGAIITMQECRVCGRWQALLDSVVADFVQAHNAHLMPFLAAHIRQANAAGEHTVELTAENWRRQAEAHAHTSIPKKLDLLLRWYEQKSAYAGDFVPVEAGLYPLVDAANQNEVGFLIQTLVDQELLKPRENRSDQFRISAKGWEYIYPHAGGGVLGRCFVAMSFKPELDSAYENAIEPALKTDCGFDSIRLDRVEHSENINDKILGDIRGAQFLVADFTFHPAGVYFEAGYALGLGKLVVWTCRKDHFDDRVHFDTRPYNHILWTSEADLQVRLTNRIRALVSNAKTG